MVALGSDPAVRTWTIRTSQSRDSALVGAAQGADEALARGRSAAALTLALALILAIRAVRAGVALDGDALGFRLVGDARAEDAARKHPRHGRHARAPADRRRNRARLCSAAHAGSTAADASGRQPARVCARHRRHRDVFVRADRSGGAGRRCAAEFPASAVGARVHRRSRDTGRYPARQGRPHGDDADARQPGRQLDPLLAARSTSSAFRRAAKDRMSSSKCRTAASASRRTSCPRYGASSRVADSRGPTAAASGSRSSAESSPTIKARSCSTANRAKARRQRYIYPSRETEQVAERILIVEDDPTLRRVLRDNLVFEGYRVEAVADGKSAINYVRASSPDLIVLDLTLPDVDGLDLCPVLRQSGKVPIIILSARGQKADKLRGPQAGRRRLHHEAVRPAGTAGTSERGAAALASGARASSHWQARHRLPLAARELRTTLRST